VDVDSETGRSSDGHRHFVDLADAEVVTEERRRTSLETRGLSLVTIAGTLVTTLAAVAAVVRNRTGYLPSALEGVALTVSVVALIGAAGFGVAANAPRRTSLVDPDSLLKVARDRWRDPEEDIDATILATHVEHLRDAQRANDVKGVLLVLGMAFLALATLGLGVATVVALYR
jgi:hypothetical protein